MEALIRRVRQLFACGNQKEVALMKRRIERELHQAGYSRKEAMRKAAEIVAGK